MIEWVNLTIVKFVMESIFMSIFFPRLIILKDDGMYRTQSFVTCKHALTAGNTLRQDIQITQHNLQEPTQTKPKLGISAYFIRPRITTAITNMPLP